MTDRKNDPVDQPRPMDMDHERWLANVSICDFANAWCQLRDVKAIDSVRRILVIGVGRGLEALVLRWQGYEVTTYDIDERLAPDRLGSIHDMSFFEDRDFDVAIASHVLEHLPVTFLDRAVKELARVSRYALVYLPVHGKHIQLRFRTTGLRDLDYTLIRTVFGGFARPSGLEPVYMDGQHYWEMGMKGFSKREIISRLEQAFIVDRSYRNKDWVLSHNFVLRSIHPPRQ